MNWLRNILSRFFARYDATVYSPSRSWRPAEYQDARLDLTKASREVLQAKSRDFDRNSGLYSKLADTWEQYIVGTGIQLMSASSDSVWNISADAVFEKWKPLADLQSRLGFDFLQGVIARTIFIDGEIFVILTREGPYPRIQLIEAHRCKTPEKLKAQEGKTIVDGVKIDANGRPVGYWFTTGEGDSFTFIEASNVVHVFEPARVNQYRGIPYCTAVLNVLHDLEDLRNLEMRAAKDAAELSTIIKTESGEAPPSMHGRYQSIIRQGTAAGTSGSVTDTRREYYQNAVGGRNLILQRGDDAHQHVPERPGANTREYWRLLAGEVCACSGVPLSVVYPDSMQGTVYRGSLDAFAAFCRAKTAVLSGYFKRIRDFAIRGHATFDNTIARLPDDWSKTIAGTVRAPNVDIGRNSQAMIAELAAGLRTRTQIAAELGLDGKQVLKEKAEEQVFIRKLAQENGIEAEEIAAASLPAAPQINVQAQEAA